MAAAGYVTVGGEVRRTVSTSPYTLLCYGTCAMLLLAVVCVVAGAPFTGYDAADWSRLVLLTFLAQLLGHTLANVVLRTTSPTVVSLAILFEVPGRDRRGALLVGQVPPASVLPAVGAMLGGVALVIRSQGADVPEPEPPADGRGLAPGYGAAHGRPPAPPSSLLPGRARQQPQDDRQGARAAGRPGVPRPRGRRAPRWPSRRRAAPSSRRSTRAAGATRSGSYGSTTGRRTGPTAT